MSFGPGMTPSYQFSSLLPVEPFGRTVHEGEQGGWDTNENTGTSWTHPEVATHVPTWEEILNRMHPSDLEALSNMELFAAPPPTPMPFDLGTPAAPVQTTVQPHYPFTVPTEQFPSILVDGAFAEDIKEYLEKYLPNARQLKLFVMEISNVTWSTSFSKSIGRWPTADLCEKIIDQTCERRRRNNRAWRLEQGTNIPFLHRYNPIITISPD